MKLVNFRRLKIGRRSRVRERKRSSKLPTNKDKFLPLEKTWTGNKSVAVDTGRNGATEDDLGDRETVLADQGGSGVPALLTDKRLYRVTAHEVERPGTQLLVRTEVSRLIRVG